VCDSGSAIHAAITGKDPFNTVSFLLDQKPSIANLVDLSGVTPLFLSSYQGDLNVINLLLSLGAEP
jgi:ankyrin repeat protein